MHQRLAHREERLHGLGVLALVVETVDLAAGVEEPVEELRERPADGVLRERRERVLSRGGQNLNSAFGMSSAYSDVPR